MPVGVTTVLRELERRKSEFGGVAGQRKLELLKILEKRRLPRAADVLRLHEVLCFLRAYPDDAELLARVERMLDGFTDRGDLRRHRAALLNSGIAGTTTCHSFYPATACWLARRWGPCLTIVWDDFQRQERLEQILPQFALYCETPGLDECTFELREWIERLKAPGETDGTFLLRRFEQLPMSPFVREILLEDLDLPLQLSPGPDTPSRTREKYSGSVVVFQSGPLQRSRPSVKNMIRRPPLSIRETTPRKAQALIDLARSV